MTPTTAKEAWARNEGEKRMSEAKKRALEHLRLAAAYLEDRREILDWHVHLAEELRYLRAAIQAIGAWQPLETAPKDGRKVSLLLQSPGSVPWAQDCYWWHGAHAEGWSTFGDGWVRAGIKVLAWKPADSIWFDKLGAQAGVKLPGGVELTTAYIKGNSHAAARALERKIESQWKRLGKLMGKR